MVVLRKLDFLEQELFSLLRILLLPRLEKLGANGDLSRQLKARTSHYEASNEVIAATR